MMLPKLYLETSVTSYLVARPSRDVVTAGRQEVTRIWWEEHRSRYDLFISAYVRTEAGNGDITYARLRLDALTGIPEAEMTEAAMRLAQTLIEPGPIPTKATLDAFHIAAAVSVGADYLLTWNFKHLANAALRTRIEEICRDSGYEPPIICTPEELDAL